ncbi:hypothetical protein [Aquaticitalea lipolytica]|uniref:hypothetical protein n=1 Tax=Aquaticitalea lipolytica TaxID=1247562 RepID=UPI0024BA3CD6|nr:hypothetical protein [Aquaticitalea lipolytica]
MTKVFFIISFLSILSFNAFSQENINDYKYVIIPNQYSFVSSPDQYQLNSLTKFLFDKYGYTAFLQSEELPQDLRNNRCLALYVDVKKLSAFLKTKLQIELKNCDGVLVSLSKEGETREKEYSKAYNLALRDAFETYQSFNYKYKPSDKNLAKESTSVVNTNNEAEIERLQEELKLLKEEKNIVEVVISEEKSKKVEPIIQEVKVKEDNLSLYAQATNNGFQVVDNTPKVVMILLKTSKENTFIVKGENAIVYEEDGFWYISKNDGVKVSVERLDIKF